MKKVLVTTIFAVIMISSSLFYVSCSKENKTDATKQNLEDNQALTLNGILGGSMYVGFRDVSDNSILDVNVQEIHGFFSDQVLNEGAHSFTLDGIFINDNTLEEGYIPSLIVEFTFLTTETITVDSIVSTEDVSYSARIQYILHYDEIKNRYLLLNEDDLPSEVNGGRLACLAKNCIGCKNEFDRKGRANNCSDCTPPDPKKDWSCGLQNNSREISIGGIHLHF